MERKKASEFDQELLNLFDQYVHGAISRRDFMDGAAKFAVGGLTAAAIFEALRPNYAYAEQVPQDDKRLKTEYVNAKGKLPGVLVVHENRGLNPYIEDVARRLGVAGFLSLAPDELTSVGGYPGDDEKGGALQAKLDQKKMMEDWAAAAAYLKSRPDCTGKIGVVGFCYGGGVANNLAVRMPDLGAAVPFYGMQPSAEDVAKIKAPLLIHYGGLDNRVNAGWPAFEAALKANHVNYSAYIYEGANHGFHNDTTPRYDKASAELAWSRTLEFFNKTLR